MTIAMIRNDQQVLQNTREPMDQSWYRLIRDIVRAVNQTTVPVGGVVWCNLTAQNIADYFDIDGRGLAVTPYDGWHICNGNNSTPSMSAKFLRSSVTAAGGTGGSDSSAHTHDMSHIHTSFETDAPSATAEVAAGVGSTVASSDHTHSAQAPIFEDNTGAASVTDNKPAYFELVPLIRVGGA